MKIFISDAAKAIEDQREKRKTAKKRKIEFLKQQKEEKLKRLKELESQKLPEDLLENLASSEPVSEENPPNNSQDIAENTRKVFNEDGGSDSNSDEYNSETGDVDGEKVIETKSTKFNIVTSKDLTADKYRNHGAWSFREQMLFGSNRLNREDHSKKKIQNIKHVAGGNDKHVGLKL